MDKTKTTDAARLITEAASSAEMKLDIAYIKRDIAEIRDGFKSQASVYLTQKEHLEAMTAINLLIAQTNKRIDEVERKDGLQKYLWPVISSSLTAVLVFLIIQYLQQVK